jgi:hypothetical protein
VSFDRNALAALLTWLGLGLLLGLLERPYQWLSKVGFELQRRLWLDAVGVPWHGAALVFVGASLLLWLAWGPLAAGRGGGLTPVLAMQQGAPEAAMQERLSLRTQLIRLPLMVLTHLAGMSVGVESPSDSRFRPLLAQLDVPGFETLLRDWMAAQPGVTEALDTLVCDGKTLRGSIAENETGAARFIAQLSLYSKSLGVAIAQTTYSTDCQW